MSEIFLKRCVKETCKCVKTRYTNMVHCIVKKRFVKQEMKVTKTKWCNVKNFIDKKIDKKHTRTRKYDRVSKFF